MINADNSLTGCKFKYYDRVEIFNHPFLMGTEGFVYNCFGSKETGFRYFVYIRNDCEKNFISVSVKEENLKRVFERYEPGDPI